MKQNEWIYLDAIGSLYQEAVLVYFDVPELFVCIDDRGQRYLTLCLSPEDGRYLISPISLRYLYALLNQKCKIKECFLRSIDEACYLTSYDDEMMVFSCNYLPDEDAVYDVPFDSFMRGYCDRIGEELKKQRDRYLNISAATQAEKMQYYHVIKTRQHDRNFKENRRYIKAKKFERGENVNAY